jgi:hypothetical protein
MTAGTTMSLAISGALPCAQCGTKLTRPVWSEPVDARQVRHLWNCSDCGYVFETQVFFCADAAAELAPPLAA